MGKVNIHDAKTRLSRLVDEAAMGEEIIIAKSGKPVARLVPIKPAAVPRRKGLLKNKIKIHPDFYRPLPEQVLAAFEGRMPK
ncbi:MAG: type II toxin-antitoxin system Phd/YefM family antitoxin [Gammaproteobacteria bacterium]|nr:MAG: type II toxin-antitoxin system Phd/YefM family antitoxin [Gammaproteobacteria bacterium]